MPARNRHGGLHRGTLFDTNIPATSIDKDIFTDQEVESTIADDDLVLMLDVSESPDQIKYMTRSNFTAGLSGSQITVTDNESTNENNLVTFVADAGTSTGLHSIEMDGNLNYNPSTGTLSAPNFSGTATTATVATTVTITDNESTNETNAVIFTAGGDVDGGNLGLESDGDFTYNPSSGTVAATTFSGALSGNATTATALASGRTIGMTGDVVWTSASFDGSGNVTGSATIQANSVALGTDTTGDYVGAITGGTGIDSTAGTSGEGTSHTLSIDLAEVGEVSIAHGDYIAFMDTTDSNATKKEAIEDVAELFAGTGLTASSSVIGVDASQTQITAVGTIATGTWEATDVGVAHGGTGASSLTDGGVLLGSGTSAVTAMSVLSDGEMIVGDGSGDPVAESGATLRTSIGVGTGDSPQFTAIELGHASNTTLARSGAGDLTIEGNAIYRAGGTDVAIADGGTGAGTATAGFDALSPMSAEGDIIYGGTSGTVTRLGKGSDDQVLTLASGVPSWEDASATSSLSSSSANQPVFSITNTHADATAGFLKYVKDPGSGQGADNDILGTITFHGTDASNNAAEELARMEAYVIEADHGSEAGGIKFYVAENDATMTAGLQVLGVKDADGEIDVTIGAGTASTTTIAGTLTMGSTAAMTNAGLVSVANQSNITGVGTISSGTWEATDVAVAHGGTGASTLTANGVLIGNGTSAVTAVDMSTKGGLLAGDGSGNPSVLAVGGTGGHVLTVDSSEATGMKWAASSSGAVTAINNATANELVTIGSTTSELDAEANLTYASDILTTASSSADLPRIDITNTHAGATAGKIRFNKDSGSGDDNDVMGTIEWYGTDAAENTHERLAYIDSYIIDSAHGSEAAGLRFYVAENDATNTLGLQILGQADDNGEVDVIIGAGAASTTTIAGTLTMGSTAAMTNAGLVAVANQSSITGLGTVSSGTWEATDVAVAHGGTGASTLTDGGVLLGSGTGAITAMSVLSDGEMIVGDGSGDPVAESGATLRTSIGVGTGDSPQFTGIELSHASDNTLTASSGDLSIEGNVVYRAGGTDVPVSDGGTGASTLTDGGVLLGSGTSAVTAMAVLADGEMIVGDGSTDPVAESGATLRTSIGVGTGDTPQFGGATLASSSASEPILHITNTHAGATAGIIRFNKDSGSGDDNDVMGTIEFYGTDAAENTHEKLAYIDSYIIDSAHGSEAAGLRFYVAENDATNTLGLQILGQADDNGEVDIVLGAGAASTTTIAGTLTMGSTAAMTNAGLLSVANQSSITGLGTISSGVWNGTAIASSYIAADAITGAKIADDAIDSEHYTDGSIDTAHIADNQVTVAKLADLSRGSIIVGNASAASAALAVGSANQVLKTDGTDISWGSITVLGTVGTGVWNGTAIATAYIADNAVTLAKMAGLARGKIIYGDASGDPAALAVGTAGYVLQTDGTDLAYSNSLLAADFVIGEDAQTKIDFETNNEIHFDVDNAERVNMTSAGIVMADDTTITLQDEGQLIFTDDDPSTDDTGVGIVMKFTALTGLAVGELVHIDANGKIDQAHADAAADMPAIGISLEANGTGSDGEVKVLLQGVYKDTDQFNFTPGAAVYVDHGTEGNFQQTPSTTDGHFIQRVGIALTADSIYFNPSMDVIERD